MKVLSHHTARWAFLSSPKRPANQRTGTERRHERSIPTSLRRDPIRPARPRWL